jgi:hypothetical protein
VICLLGGLFLAEHVRLQSMSHYPSDPSPPGVNPFLLPYTPGTYSTPGSAVGSSSGQHRVHGRTTAMCNSVNGIITLVAHLLQVIFKLALQSPVKVLQSLVKVRPWQLPGHKQKTAGR